MIDARTTGGRAFTTVTKLAGDNEHGVHLWIPMVDGSERLGLAELCGRTAPRDPDRLRHHAETVVALLAHLISVKSPYGDLLARLRRTRPMTTLAR
ncbi:hypothetical protein [Paractinoplanes lichenicola]|uniref:GAF domain-containing protein n=1 Tax=Paractinoplanes lichenicola TaxID=2802976 RepID=A0ABS1VVS5_9ACTN|nr:hypothetical protein [Actinoplanes lichenicola]MBL7258581.1 hypothetical protein [Actinoplanes lichenicola]